MKLPARIKAKWVKALRSGDYKQTKGTLYNTDSKSFCCLGVLQHITMGGKVQCQPECSLIAEDEPTLDYWNNIKAEVTVEKSRHKEGTDWVKDLVLGVLISMNDADNPEEYQYDFNEIADYIEKNVGVT